MTRLALTPYAELQVTSNFTFLTGGSHPQELVAQAKALGLSALAITDRNTLAGVVRAHTAAKAVGLRLIVGTCLDLEDAPSLLCLPTDRAAYGRLCTLLSLGQMRSQKGKCSLRLEDVAAHAQGQIFIALPPQDWAWREVEGRFAPLAQAGPQPIRANFTLLPPPFAFPEAEWSEAIRDLHPSDGGEDPGSSRSDLAVGSLVRGRSGDETLPTSKVSDCGPQPCTRLGGDLPDPPSFSA